MAPTPDKPVVDFYFDVSCPSSYLALDRLREAAIRTAARVVFRPVLAVDLAGQAPADTAYAGDARARYRAKDLADWARYCGVVLRRPDPWPRRPEWAQRGAVAAAALGGTAAAGAFVTATFTALFAENRNLGDLGVVEAVAAEAGLETAAFAARVRDESTLREVLDNNARLVAAGGFGTPSFVVGAGGTLADFYFGNDRLPLVEAALARAGDLRLVLPGEHGA